MLKLKIFNAKKPTQTQELEFLADPNAQNNYLLGRSSQCSIMLPNPEIDEIQGSISLQEEQYYFIPYSHSEKIQFNDEWVAENEQYLLTIDDIIRLQEFVLIVESVPSNGKRERKKSKPSTASKSKPASEKNSNRLDQLKNRLKKKSQAENTENIAQTVEIAPISVAKLPYPSADPSNLIISSTPVTDNQWTKGELTVKCVGVIAETNDVKTFRFMADPAIAFTYKPGQFVTLILEINGKPIKRSYSISATPSRPQVLEITVKRVPPPPKEPHLPPGLVSNWLHDNIKVGSQIKINPPGGKFTCVDHSVRKLLLISAGSGITPMMSMSRWIYDTAADYDIIFLHSARSSQDIIFAQELNLLAAQNSRFKLILTLTRPNAEEKWNGLTGRLDEAMIQQIAPDYNERAVYVCGPSEFMKGTKALLQQIDFPMENYFEESFGGTKKEPTKEKKATVASDANIIFSLSGKEIKCSSDDLVLELAEQEAMGIASGCRSGNCGTCKVRKLEGEVNYECDPDGLSEGDKADGYILSCIGHPVGKVVLEV